MSIVNPHPTQDRNPLVNYVKNNLWGNPDNDLQHQVKLARVSPELGFINTFVYMGRHRVCPQYDFFFNVFSLGGLDIGFYNLGSRNRSWAPFDVWINASEYSAKRGVVLDFYNGQGMLYPRTQTWIMNTFNGETLVAFQKNDHFPMPVGKNMYMRCYSSDLVINTINGVTNDELTFKYSGTIYYDFKELDRLRNDMSAWKKDKIGIVISTVNGYIKDIEDFVPNPGDLLEVFHDPTVEKVLRFNYNKLNNFYSTRDKKRKFLIFPWFNDKPRPYKYFDDCDFYVYNNKTKTGLYYNRNHEDAVRQITHQDYSLSGDYVDYLADKLIAEDKTNSSNKNNIEIVVNYRKTAWEFYLGPNSSRITELYLLEDPNQILEAMIGNNSLIPEWTAPVLEDSPHARLLGSTCSEINTEISREALGYHGCSYALSNGPLYMPYITPDQPDFDSSYITPPYLSGSGYRIPPSFMIRATAYEYDKNGHYLRRIPVINQETYIPRDGCYFVEFVVGDGDKWPDGKLAKSDVVLDPHYSFRVYMAPWAIGNTTTPEKVNEFWKNEWSIYNEEFIGVRTNEKVTFDYKKEDPNEPPGRPWDGGEIVGPWVDVTGTDKYKVTGNVLSWNEDMTNYIGLVLFDSKHYFNEFELEHIDNSYYFDMTVILESAGIIMPIIPAQLNIFLNNKPISENIDYFIDGTKVFIINKMNLIPGNKQNIKIIGLGLYKEGNVPSSELGFVANGVIGFNGRYNVRVNRPTKTICGGRLLITNSLDWAETKGHGNNLQALEGFPYEVKHIYCINKYVEPFVTNWGFEKDRELDERITSYLTEFVKYKPKEPPKIIYQSDKYIIFSTFMNQLYNELKLGFIRIPGDKEDPITDQMVNELTKNIQWLLKYDPVFLNFSEVHFAIHPYANTDRQPITPRQLAVLEKANELYLDGKLRLRLFFEVTTNV